MNKSIEEMSLSEVMERLVKKHGLMEVVSVVNGHRYTVTEPMNQQAEERFERV